MPPSRDKARPVVTLEDATLEARRYFEKAHGAYGVLGFEVRKASEETSAYVIECAFWVGLGAREKTRYSVRVDRRTGRVVRVDPTDTTDA